MSDELVRIANALERIATQATHPNVNKRFQSIAAMKEALITQCGGIDLQGARKALKNKEADLFMWEKFTTKPLVDSGEWSRVAEVPTPWPCFAVVCTPEIARQRRDDVSEVLGSVYEKASRISEKDVAAIAADYHLKPADVAEWLTGVKWGPGVRMPSRVIDDCTRALLEAGVLEQGEVKSYREVVSDWTLED